VSDEAGADWLTADLGIGEDAMPLETDRGLHSNGSVQWTVGPGLSHLDGDRCGNASTFQNSRTLVDGRTIHAEASTV
jgi:hypothetical protein